VIRDQVRYAEVGRVELSAPAVYASPSEVKANRSDELIRFGTGKHQLDYKSSEWRLTRALGETPLEARLEFGARIRESGREPSAEEMVVVPVLGYEHAARPEPWEERLEGCACRFEAMRGVVDDEAQRLVSELLLEDCRQPTSVRLVDAVVQADATAEIPLADQLVQGSMRSGAFATP
jgi:hypothetical protein